MSECDKMEELRVAFNAFQAAYKNIDGFEMGDFEDEINKRLAKVEELNKKVEVDQKTDEQKAIEQKALKVAAEAKALGAIAAATSKVSELCLKFTNFKTEMDIASTLILKSAMQGVFDDFEGRLVKIAVKGYTPSFNDGDECTHSQYVDLDDNSNLTNEEADKLGKYFDGLEDEFHFLYGTNWVLNISYGENREIEIVLDDYDCGY